MMCQSINNLKLKVFCSFMIVFFILICPRFSLAITGMSITTFKNTIVNYTDIEIDKLDFENYTYESNKYSISYNTLINSILGSATYNKYLQVGDQNFNNTDTCITLYILTLPEYNLGFKFSSNYLVLTGRKTNGAENNYYLKYIVFDTQNRKVIAYNGENYEFKCEDLNFNNYDLTLDQFKSNDFQRIKYWNMFIYSDNDFLSSNNSIINNTWNGQYVSDNLNQGGLVDYGSEDNLFLYNFVKNGNVSGDFINKIYLQILKSSQITSPDDKFGALEDDNIRLLKEDTFSNVISFSNDIALNDIPGLSRNYIYRVVFKTYEGSNLVQEGYSQFFSLQKYYKEGIIIENLRDVYIIPDDDTPSGDSSGDGKLDLSGIIGGISDLKDDLVGSGDGIENTGLIGKILRGLLSLFVPDEEFFNEYWESLRVFFSDKLGFLWDVIVFIPNLIDNFKQTVSAYNKETVFTIPAISIPTFMGDNSEVVILESFEWKPYAFIGSNDVFLSIYKLYLDLVDFLVFWALMNQLVSVLKSILGMAEEDEEDTKGK